MSTGLNFSYLACKWVFQRLEPVAKGEGAMGLNFEGMEMQK